MRLVEQADVFVENLKTSTLRRLGIHESLLLDRNFLPTCNWIGIVEEADVKDKFLKLAQRHLRILGVSNGGIQG